MLRLAGLTKSFGPVRALVDVSLALAGGQVVGLLGENGAGKSTLLRTLSGDHRPDAGQVFVDERPVTFAAPRDARAERIHVVYQEPEVAPHLTVAENLFLGELPGTRRHTVSPRRVEEAAAALVEREGFGGTIDPGRLLVDCSPAQRQCVEILKAVRGGARVLCLDEPTSSLSDEEAERLWALMERLRTGGAAIVYVSHRMAEIERLCQRVVVMRDGRVVGDHPAGSLSADETLRLMVGRPLSRFFPDRRQARGAPIVAMEGVGTASVTDISLSVHEGEVVGLAGLVGAGRTEVARALAGVDPIRAGRVVMDGRELRLRSPRDAMRAGICMAPEDRRGEALFLQRSVSDNVSLPLLARLSRGHVVSTDREREVVTGTTARMRLKTHSLDSPVGTLSGGNQQKVVLARWIAMQPRLLILDEPTRGIDVGVKAEIYALLDELVRGGLGVLLISSELPEVLGLADRIVVLREGRIEGEIDAGQATEELVLGLALGHRKEAS